MEHHPLAGLIPSMAKDEYCSLRDDIKENGLQEPITLYEGKILDGRHRWQACEELGIEPKTREYEGDDPARFVVSMNLHRRHLTVAQRAEIALALAPYYKEQARKRQGHRADLERTSVPVETEVQPKPLRAFDQAAADAGVGTTTVERLHRIKRDRPDLHEKVVAGEMTLAKADNVRAAKTGPEDGHKRKRDITKPFEINSRRDETLALAAKRRLEALIAVFQGYNTGIQNFDVRRATAMASPNEVHGWIRVITDSTKSLRSLRGILQEVLEDGRYINQEAPSEEVAGRRSDN